MPHPRSAGHRPSSLARSPAGGSTGRWCTADSSSAGAIYSTVGDLYRWDQALITGTPRLVAPLLLQQVLTVHASCPYESCPLAADRGYGYGWFIGGTGRARLVNHSGSVLGFWAHNGFYPVRDIVVVVLGNLDTIDINAVSAQLNLLAGHSQPAAANR